MIPLWLQHGALVAALAVGVWLITMSGGRRNDK
jgi:hydroxymethylglutaryl-CoA reductase